MKNIKLFKFLFNKKGTIQNSMIAGIGCATLAAFVGYGVYNSYHNSPAYNPAQRAIYTGEGQNLSVNSLTDSSMGFETGADVYGTTPYTASDNIEVSNNFAAARKEKENFEAARSYIEAQKSGQKTAVGQKGGEAAPTPGPRGAYDGDFGAIPGQSGVNTVSMTEDQTDKPWLNKSGQNGRNAGQNKGGNSGKADGKSGGNSTAKLQPSGNSLTVSSGGTSVGTSSGGTSSSGAINTYGTPAKGTKGSPGVVSKTVKSAKSDTPVFKHGRSGTMGGFDVAQGGGSGGQEGGGTRGGEKGGKGGNTVTNELNRALFYSKKAAGTLQAAGEKGLANAADNAARAFDGSADTVADGADIGKGIALDMGAGDFSLETGKAIRAALKPDLDEVISDSTKMGIYQRNVNNHMYCAALAVAAACLVIYMIMKMTTPYKYALAAIVTLSAIYAIFGMDYDGDGKGIFETMSELADLRKKNNYPDQSWIYQLLMWGVYLPALGLSWFLGIRAAKKAASGFLNFMNMLAKGEVINTMRKQIMGFFGSSGSKAK